MKNFICAASFALAFAMVIPTAQAAGPSDAKVPHLTSSGPDPNNPRHSHLGNYIIRVHVTGRSLTQLMIEAPSGVQLSKAITITDQSGKPISATVSLNGQKATLAFAQSISPDTTLEIDLKNVKTPLDPPTWFFSVSSQLSGLNVEIPLGSARIQPRLRD
jgi:hypothetical protein